MQSATQAGVSLFKYIFTKSISNVLCVYIYCVSTYIVCLHILCVYIYKQLIGFDNFCMILSRFWHRKGLKDVLTTSV